MSDKRTRSLAALESRRLGFDARRFIESVEAIARFRGMTLCGMCLHIGVSYATVTRMKRYGLGCGAAQMLAMARWSGINPVAFAIDREEEPA